MPTRSSGAVGLSVIGRGAEQGGDTGLHCSMDLAIPALALTPFLALPYAEESANAHEVFGRRGTVGHRPRSGAGRREDPTREGDEFHVSSSSFPLPY